MMLYMNIKSNQETNKVKDWSIDIHTYLICNTLYNLNYEEESVWFCFIYI